MFSSLFLNTVLSLFVSLSGVHSRSSGSLGGGGVGTRSSARSDYEVPENIKTLHHLALQYVNQVGSLDLRQCGGLNLSYFVQASGGKDRPANIILSVQCLGLGWSKPHVLLIPQSCTLHLAWLQQHVFAFTTHCVYVDVGL